MGYGSYNFQKRAVKASQTYKTQSVNENFRQRQVHVKMDASDLKVREARDSVDHPNSFPILLGIDTTGSMQSIPQELIRDSLPKIVEGVQNKGIPDPAICIMGIGDHRSDRAPLQVGQFESSDDLMDKWLESLYLEGNGGGNGGESYALAWLVGGYMTATDQNEKRNAKGLLVTIGDEAFHKEVRVKTGLAQDVPSNALDLLKVAQEKYDVYHISIPYILRSNHYEGESEWREALGNNYIQLPSRSVDNIAPAFLEIVSRYKSKMSTATTQPEVEGVGTTSSEGSSNKTSEEQGAPQML